MSVDLDNPQPECAQWARLLESATAERNSLRAQLRDLRGLVEAQGKLLAELPPSADQLIMAEMNEALAKTELKAIRAQLSELDTEGLPLMMFQVGDVIDDEDALLAGSYENTVGKIHAVIRRILGLPAR